MDRGLVLGFGILVVYLALTASGASWARDVADADGSARVVVDGEPARYLLWTGFGGDTDFSAPKRATVVFGSAKDEPTTNPRRIQLTLDATRTGRHSTSEDRVFFKLIEDGGQNFPPKDTCEIEIRSAYRGGPDSLYAGRIDDCHVHSAGIDHVVSVEFEMKGVPKRF